MNAIHYLAGYDRGDNRLRAELRIPDAVVGAIQALIAYTPDDAVIFVEPDLVQVAADIAGLALPACATELDWFVDIYSRGE